MKITTILILCGLWWSIPAAVQALTPEEILLLQRNGVSEATIQMMLQSEMQARSIDAAGGGTRTIERSDGRPAIVYSTGGDGSGNRDDDARLQEERAWEMLRHIIVDTRSVRE